MSGFVHSWITGLVIMLGCPLSAFSTVGWETGDMVLDFGLNLESGESTVLVDKSEVGEPFFVELTWKLNPRNCLKQIHTSRGGEGGPATTKAVDDGLFNGVISHAVFQQVEEVVVMAPEGQRCEIQPSHDEFLVVARAPRAPMASEEGWANVPIGAVVVLYRATTFFFLMRSPSNPDKRSCGSMPMVRKNPTVLPVAAVGSMIAPAVGNSSTAD